jgi:hypothetical protein
MTVQHAFSPMREKRFIGWMMGEEESNSLEIATRIGSKYV